MHCSSEEVVAHSPVAAPHAVTKLEPSSSGVCQLSAVRTPGPAHHHLNTRDSRAAHPRGARTRAEAGMSTQYSGRAAMMAKMASMAGSLRDDGAAPVRPRERASGGRTHPSARPVGTPRSRAPLRAGSRRAARARRRVVGSAARVPRRARAPVRDPPGSRRAHSGVPRPSPTPPAPLAFPIVTVPALTNPRFKNIHFLPRRSCAT